MPFEIKNTKDFPYFKDFLKLEAACIVQHLVYNNLIMHMTMSWMKSIKCRPPILQKQATTANYTKSHSLLRGRARRAASHSQGEDCILKAGSQDGEKTWGEGDQEGATMVGPQDTFPPPCTWLLPPLQHVNGRYEPPSLLIDWFRLMRREHDQEFGKTLSTSPHVQFTFIVWTCVLNITSEQTLLCPVTIKL